MEHNFSDFCMEEHPQVRAYNNGFESLTVVELISMIIGTGTKRNVEQARQIYNVMGQSLRNIAKARPEELQVVQGIGDTRLWLFKLLWNWQSVSIWRKWVKDQT